MLNWRGTQSDRNDRVDIGSGDRFVLQTDEFNLVGDAIEQPVSWTKGSDVSSLAGKPVRLRFVMQEADLFAMQFQQ